MFLFLFLQKLLRVYHNIFLVSSSVLFLYSLLWYVPLATEAFEILKQKKFCARLTSVTLIFQPCLRKPFQLKLSQFFLKHIFEDDKLVFSPLLKWSLFFFFFGVIVRGI